MSIMGCLERGFGKILSFLAFGNCRMTKKTENKFMNTASLIKSCLHFAAERMRADLSESSFSDLEILIQSNLDHIA